MKELPIPFEDISVRSDFAFARSDFLDTFARLEADLARILRTCGKAQSGEPFGNRVKAFRSVEKTPLIAKINLPERDQIADAITELLPVRADIVHAEMRVGSFEDKPVAVFVNAQRAHEILPLVRLLTLDDFSVLQRKLAAIRERIAALGRKISPAS